MEVPLLAEEDPFLLLVGLVIMAEILPLILAMVMVLKHPINFPFSDGILVAEPVGTLVRMLVLLVITLIAGFIPARMIVRKNTLDSILGR
jgi:ABC-type antimicrobial peptide transport system permease subunit